MSQLFIGWSGRARHGKTECTLAVKEYAESQGKTVGVYDVGAMILQLCKKQNRVPAGITRAELTREHIQLLIDVGKEMKEQFGQDYWAKRIVDSAHEDNFDVGMCPNLRLPTEASAVRAINGTVVRCTRLNSNGSLYISPDRDPNDITETGMEFWPADFYLTHVSSAAGSQLIRMQAVTLYKYLAGYTC